MFLRWKRFHLNPRFKNNIGERKLYLQSKLKAKVPNGDERKILLPFGTFLSAFLNEGKVQYDELFGNIGVLSLLVLSGM